MVSLNHSSTRRASEDMCEKGAAAMHLEDQPRSGISPEERDFLNNFTDEAKAKVLRKVAGKFNNLKLTSTELTNLVPPRLMCVKKRPKAPTRGLLSLITCAAATCSHVCPSLSDGLYR